MTDQPNPFASPQTDAGESATNTPGVPYSESYRSTQSLGQSLRRIYWVLFALSVAFVPAQAYSLATVNQAWASPNITPIDTVFMALGVAFLVAMIVLLFAFCRWKYRSYANLRAFGVEDTRMTPRWAVGYYFIPIVNLYMPFRAMKDIINGSAGKPVETGVGFVTLWWTMHVLSGVAESTAGRMEFSATTLAAAQSAELFGLVGSVLTVIALPLEIRVIREADKRQLAAARAAGIE
ncbi:MAG: DUF4328 domain-containing protein [Planctomycetota bacterium]